MAKSGRLVPVLVVAFALMMAGGLMEGARADSFVRRRLAAQRPGVATATVVPQKCPITCWGTMSTCCQYSPPAYDEYFCANTQTDGLNCGVCGAFCVNSVCCNGKCSDMQSDPANCGVCGRQCAARETCISGLCDYSG